MGHINIYLLFSKKRSGKLKYSLTKSIKSTPWKRNITSSVLQSILNLDTCYDPSQRTDSQYGTSAPRLTNSSQIHFSQANFIHSTQQAITQASLALQHGGMELLSPQEQAPAAFLPSLRNLISEFIFRNPTNQDPLNILQSWSFENQAKHSWENHHHLVDQMFHQGIVTPWSHDAFLALPQTKTQQKLQHQYSAALDTNLAALMDPRN